MHGHRHSVPEEMDKISENEEELLEDEKALDAGERLSVNPDGSVMAPKPLSRNGSIAMPRSISVCDEDDQVNEAHSTRLPCFMTRADREHRSTKA